MYLRLLDFFCGVEVNSTFLTGLSFPSYGLLSTMGDTLTLDLFNLFRGKYLIIRLLILP